MPHHITTTVDEQALALATKQAIQAAGGLEVCARETGLSTSQLSRCNSPYHSDSITARAASIIDSLTHGHPGHPFILRARARQLRCLVIEMPDPHDDHDHLLASVTDLTISLGETARAIHEAMHPHGDGGTDVTPAEARQVLAALEEHDRKSARLRKQLERLADTSPVRSVA